MGTPSGAEAEKLQEIFRNQEGIKIYFIEKCKVNNELVMIREAVTYFFYIKF